MILIVLSLVDAHFVLSIVDVHYGGYVHSTQEKNVTMVFLLH